MFRCTWLHAPREPTLATRLYTRTYGRTYGRRPCEADQPRTLPSRLSVTEAPSMQSTCPPVAAGDNAAANATDPAARIERVA